MFDKAGAILGRRVLTGEKECAAGNEVSAITRHRIFVCGLDVGEGTVLLFKVLTLLELALSDDIGGRLKC